MEKVGNEVHADTDTHLLSLAVNRMRFRRQGVREPVEGNPRFSSRCSAVSEHRPRAHISHCTISGPSGPGAAAARSYAKIATDAHSTAQPSHTFKRSCGATRCGQYRVVKPRRSTRYANMQEMETEVCVLQTAQVPRRADIRRVAALPVFETQSVGARHRVRGSMPPCNPARYALERGEWKAAASLEDGDESVRLGRRAVTVRARARAARSGNTGGARAEIGTRCFHDKLVAANDSYGRPVEIQRRVAEAGVAYPWTPYEGRAVDGGADAEDATDKAAVTPGPLTPARELLSDMLLEGGQAAGALKAYEATMAKEQNRFRAVYGGARAAAAAGDRTLAATYYRQLLDICRPSDTERPALKEAKAFLENKS